MQSTLTSLSHMFLTIDHDLDHLRYLLKTTDDDLVALNKTVAVVLHTSLGGELADKLLASAEVMARYTGEEVVYGLELETAVEPIHPCRTIDVHGGAQLALGERLCGSKVGGGHAPVGKRDLYVQDHGDEMREDDIANSNLPGGEINPAEEVAEEVPVAGHEDDLERARPPCGAELCCAGRNQVQPAEEVQVESCQCHYWVVEVLLVRDYDFARGVPYEAKVVEGREDGLHVGGSDGEQGDVLNVWVVLRHVGDKMVNIVARLPPPDAKAAAEVRDECTDEGVGDEVSCDAAVAGIVCCEHDLLL
jgi:hypothetical protein